MSTVKSNGKPNVESPSEASSVTASVTVPIITDEDEDRVRRQRAEAERLANLLPVEAELYFEDRARALDMPPAKLKAAVEAVRKDKEKKAREVKAEERRQEDRAAKARTKVEGEKKKAKEREFRVIATLPEAEQEARLAGIRHQPRRRSSHHHRRVREHMHTIVRSDRALAGRSLDRGHPARVDQADATFRRDGRHRGYRLIVVDDVFLDSRDRGALADLGDQRRRHRQR